MLNGWRVGKAEYVSKAGLKHRGWTDGAIEGFAKEPDKTAPNPHYKKASPMKLYALRRIRRIEKSVTFQEFRKKSVVRVESALRAAETKKVKLLEEVAMWEIQIERKDFKIVEKAALQSYNYFKGGVAMERENYDWQPADKNSDGAFIRRITVNYLRHQLSGYERRLRSLFGKVGTHEAYIVLNEKIYMAIADTYPPLSQECARQLALKKGGSGAREVMTSA